MMARKEIFRKAMRPFRKLKRKYNINKARNLFRKGVGKKWSF